MCIGCIWKKMQSSLRFGRFSYCGHPMREPRETKSRECDEYEKVKDEADY